MEGDKIMIVYGYAKQYRYSGDGTLYVQVRIPSIHGPYRQEDAQGKQVKTYTRDQDLPYYQSILLPHLPNDGDVVMLTSLDSTANQWVIIGLTGGSYVSGVTNI